jgi:hypothetical protein
MNNIFLRFFLAGLIVGILMISCSGKADYSYAPAMKSYDESMSAPQESPILEESYDSSDMLLSRVSEEKNDAVIPSGGERKRIYSGNAELIVDDVPAVKRNIETEALRVGGYVESLNDFSIVVRVPAESFEKVFDWILSLGKVQFQSIDTADVTETYNDLYGRLQIAETSRDRLYKLLERTTDTNEQVQILKEIGRLIEEIESIKLTLQSLDSYISHSRISVTLISRLEQGLYDTRNIPFSWIRDLSPLYSSSDHLSASVTLDPGEDFALFDREDIYLSENWDGVKIRISTVDNDPLGDGLFWEKALFYHLKDFYQLGEKIETPFGEKMIYGVLWTSRDRDPFQYFVGVGVDKNDLHIVEIFSPKEDRTLIDRIFNAMKEGELK